MKKEWWHKSVVYQIYPKSFYDSNGDGIGDIRGIIEKLDYLKELGIDIVWLSPVYKSPMHDNGYDISDYYSINPQFGTMRDMDTLIEEASKLGIGIMMDMVINHTSDEHPWFVESRSSRDNPKRNWYIWRDGKSSGGGGAVKREPPNNWESFFTGSAWQFDEKSGQYYLHLFSPKQPDLNWENPDVRREIYKIMRWWLDKGIKGIRLDAVDLISKPEVYLDGKEEMKIKGMELWANGPKLHAYLQEMNEAVFSRYDIVTVGETSFADTEKAIIFSSSEGKELNMVFQFEHMGIDNNGMEKWIKVPLNLTKLKDVFGRWQIRLHGKGWNSLYWNNHDQPRIVSRFGNEEKEYRVKSAKMLATALHFMQGTPFIYQGEELGMTNQKFDSIDEFDDIDSINYYNRAIGELGISEEEALKRISWVSRDNARTPMQWSSKKNGGFSPGMPWLKINQNYKYINSEESLSDKDSVFYYYRELIRLRRNSRYSDIIAYGDFRQFYEKSNNLFVYLRSFSDERILVICNFFKEDISFAMPEELDGYRISVLMSNYSDRKVFTEYRIRSYESLVLYLE